MTMKTGNVIAILISILCLLPTVPADSFSNDVIEVQTSPYVYRYNQTTAEIVVRNPDTGNPYVDGAENISVCVQRPDGSYLINHTHPIEYIDGLYRVQFSLGGMVGTYLIWAIFSYDGIDYWGANIFEVRWSPYRNITGAELKIGNIVSLFNWIGRNNSQEIISHIGELKGEIAQSEQDTEKAGFFDTLQQTALSSLISWIFLITLMLLVFVIGTWIYGRRKASKLAMKVANVPGAILSAITGNKEGRQ